MGLSISQYSDKYDFEVVTASYAGRPLNNSVMYVTKKVEHLLHNLQGKQQCLVFVENTVDVPEQLKAENCFVYTENPQRDYAAFVGQLAQEKERLDQQRRYTLTEGGYYVGDGVTIGNGAIIEPLCFIGHDVKIGNNARIKTGAKIKNATIGDNFIAGENCIIGTFGFTMAEDEEHNKIRIPALGGVVIGNNVEIGGLTNVAVGSGGNTVIEDNVKIDMLVHIGHDGHLSKNVEIPAGAIVGGFVDMGEGAYVGINAVLRNRITIGKNAFIGMGAVVTKSVPADATVIGNPARKYERK